MAKGTKKGKILPEVFALPEGLDDKLNVVPADLLQGMVDILGQQPAAATRQILNAVEYHQKEGNITGVVDYLQGLANAETD